MSTYCMLTYRSYSHWNCWWRQNYIPCRWKIRSFLSSCWSKISQFLYHYIHSPHLVVVYKTLGNQLQSSHTIHISQMEIINYLTQIPLLEFSLLKTLCARVLLHCYTFKSCHKSRGLPIHFKDKILFTKVTNQTLWHISHVWCWAHVK